MSHRSKQGTTHFPAILKKPVTAREVFETLGFDKVNIELLRRIGYEIAEADLDASFADFAASIKQLGEYADDANSLKNRLKHSKAVFGVDFGLEEAAEVAHLEIADEKPNTNGAATAPPLVRVLETRGHRRASPHRAFTNCKNRQHLFGSPRYFRRPVLLVG
jgi:hypothetical protein